MNTVKTKRLFLTRYLPGVVIVSTLVWLGSCVLDYNHRKSDATSLVLDWNEFMLIAEVRTEGYRGPVAARTYGYVGLAAYEAAQPGFQVKQISMSSRFPEIQLPSTLPAELYNPMVALHACYATILKRYFITTQGDLYREWKMIDSTWKSRFERDFDANVIESSSLFGQQVAEAIYAWSATDSLGYNAQHHNYDRNFNPPVGEGLWVISPDFPMPPLLPYWGDVRTFIIERDSFVAKSLPSVTGEGDAFYRKQALEVVSLSRPLSADNQRIAEFWNDDRPGLTFSPAGHWLAITNQIVRKEHPSVEKTLSVYLKMGFALSDAMVACFYSKYKFNLERPETYIRKNIDPAWRPFSPAPPFPSYPSGHAMMGAAGAEILTEFFGEKYCLRDCSHEKLKDFSVPPRQFESFEAMAKENALSRLFLGVHWRIDSEEGLRLGTALGKEIRDFSLQYREAQKQTDNL